MNKQETYEQLLQQIAALIEGETDETSVLANVSAALHEAFAQFFWTGFYLVRQNELRLGPFQGTVACMHIQHGRGVCGTAWAEAVTQVVPDVEQFPGHIACSSLSRSEIVVPIMNNAHRVVGVLDIDSKELAAFDDTDRHYLERLCAMLTAVLYA
ncbi:MAG: GAF domain-containing protein [Prevotella sp.]|nr:GAF domain-containing protein [Prevotella sp.]